MRITTNLFILFAGLITLLFNKTSPYFDLVIIVMAITALVTGMLAFTKKV